MIRKLQFFALTCAALALGMPAAQASDQAFGDWVLHCADVSGGEKACALHQKIMSLDTKLQVASFAIARNKDSKDLRLAVVLPLGLDIAAGVSGRAGETAITLAVQTCVKRGCVASASVDNKLLAALHGSERLSVTFRMRGVAKPTTFDASLKGFHAGLTALDAK